MPTLAPPTNPSQKRRISHWLNQTSRQQGADAFSPTTPPLSRASSISSSIVSPGHSPSVKDIPRSRAPAQPSAQYLSSIPFYPTGPGPMPVNTAMHSVSQTQATYHPSTNGPSYPTASSNYPSSAHSHRFPTTHAPTTTSSHRQSRSMSQAPPPITIPQDYTPVSPPSGSANRSHHSGSRHGDERGRSLSRSLHHSRAENTALGTRHYYGTAAPSSYHTGSHHTSWHNPESRHRSASQHPPVTEVFRPSYHRRRSRSYDPPPVSAPTHHDRRYYDNYDNHDRGRSSAHSGIASARSQGSSGLDSSTYRMVHASPTSPTLVHPSNTQPVMIPLNDGRDGWVLIPAKGQQFKVVDPAKARSDRTLKKSEGQSFFGKLKGLGHKNKGHKDERRHHERVVTVPPENPSHYHRHRRGSY